MLGNMLINLKDNQNAINFTKGLLSVNGIDFNSFDFSG